MFLVRFTCIWTKWYICRVRFGLVNGDPGMQILKSQIKQTSIWHGGICIDFFYIYISKAMAKPLWFFHKSQKVLPLFEKGDRALIEIYRPMPVLTSISKLFQRRFVKNPTFRWPSFRSWQQANSSIYIYMPMVIDTLDYRLILQKPLIYKVKSIEYFLR